MGRAFLVKVKLEALRANLSAADGVQYTRADARQWLLDSGFAPAGPWWRAREADLRLEPTEVADAVPEAQRAHPSRRLTASRVA